MIETKHLIKTYRSGDIETPVLRGINFVAQQGEWVAIMGRSGAGKSTLLYQMSLLDEPTSGEVFINKRRADQIHESEKAQFRLFSFGYVFQDYALLPELTALENVVLPLLMQGLEKEQAYQKASVALERVALTHRSSNLPSQLSGGEQQRASIARAVAHHPKVLFADEPTANLDNESSRTIMRIFADLHREGQTIIMVTHEEEYAALAQRIVRLDDGRIV
jgi:putative ABC transport system ATP-binding protein